VADNNNDDIISQDEQAQDLLILSVENKLVVAEQFYDRQPYWFDRSLRFWLWNFEKLCYDEADETDMLNTIGRYTPYRLWKVKGKQRTELVYGLKAVGREHEPAEPPRSWIQFKDVIVDIEAGTTHRPSPAYFLTNPVPWKIGENEATPTLDRLFSEWILKEGVQDASYIQTLYEIVAYCLLRWQPAQRIFALTGCGANGKSVFLDVLSAFLGEHNVCATNLQNISTNQFATAQLHHKLLARIGEVTENDLKNTSLLKSLSGDSIIRYEIKGKMPFEDECYAKLIIGTNSLPTTPDHSVGWYRRWLIIDFPNQFPLKRKILSEIPQQEYESLAKKCVAILPELLKTNEFTNEGDIASRTEKYNQRSNPIAHFIQEECIEDVNEQVLFSDFYDRLSQFLKRHNHRSFSKQAVGKAIKEAQYASDAMTLNGVMGRYIRGLCLRINSCSELLKYMQQHEHDDFGMLRMSELCMSSFQSQLEASVAKLSENGDVFTVGKGRWKALVHDIS